MSKYLNTIKKPIGYCIRSFRFRASKRCPPRGSVDVPSVAGKRFIFIVGMHRSGTTLLSQTLASYDSGTCFDDSTWSRGEGQFFQDLVPIEGLAGGVPSFGFNKKMRRTEVALENRSSMRHRLLECWTPNWDMSKTHLIEKTPSNIIRTRFLQSLLPESAFVGILRHPGTIIAAFQARNWPASKYHPTHLIEHWLRCHEYLYEDLPYLEHVCLIRYEHLISDPAYYFDRLANWIGLAGSIQDIGPPEPVKDKHVDSWKQMLVDSPSMRHQLEGELEDRVGKFGYDLLDPNASTHCTLPNDILTKNDEQCFSKQLYQEK